MVLLAAVIAVSLAVAGVVSVLEGDAEPALRTDVEKPVALADQTPVRVIGTPFVPNTNPRQR